MIYIVVASATYAIKARNLLNKNNIKCETCQTPSTIAGRKCSYSIVIADKKYYQKSIDIVSNNNCYLLGVYESRDGGMYEYVLE